MNEESFENINEAHSLKAIIESDHWRSAEDPVGFIAFTLYLMDLKTGFIPREHLYDTYEICVTQAEKSYGFDPKTWTKREAKITNPILRHRIPEAQLKELDEKIARLPKR